MSKHPIHIYWSPEYNSWIATCPGLSGLHALGSTPEGALSSLAHEQEDYFRVQLNAGGTIPEPIYYKQVQL